MLKVCNHQLACAAEQCLSSQTLVLRAWFKLLWGILPGVARPCEVLPRAPSITAKSQLMLRRCCPSDGMRSGSTTCPRWSETLPLLSGFQVQE